ncbi:MAG: DUF5941 domain-containing protein [Frankiaceae bacterium]
MSAGSALVDYRDDGPVAVLVAAMTERLAGGPRPDPALLTVAGVVPVAVVAALPGGGPPALLGAGFGWLVLSAGAGAVGPLTARLDWLVPPLLRTVEYGLLLRLAGLNSGGLAGCYALLAAVAYHHYDVVYRIRTRRSAPPRWLQMAGGGWDGRLLAGYALFRAGRLAPGLKVGAGLLGGLFATESVRSWLPHRRDQQLAPYQDDEADEE